MDADKLDGAIRIFKPDMDLAEIRPKAVPHQHAAFEGEVRRAVLDALRETGLALTIKGIALRMMEARKLSATDARLVRVVEKKVGAARPGHRAVREGTRGQPALEAGTLARLWPFLGLRRRSG